MRYRIRIQPYISPELYRKLRKGYPRYVQVPPEVAQTIRVGDKVAIGSAPDRWVKPSDERIVRFARGTMASTIRRRISERSRRVVGVLRRADPHRPSWSRRTSDDWSASNGTDWPNAKRMDAGACRQI